jgi:hypothetical protein
LNTLYNILQGDSQEYSIEHPLEYSIECSIKLSYTINHVDVFSQTIKDSDPAWKVKDNKISFPWTINNLDNGSIYEITAIAARTRALIFFMFVFINKLHLVKK